MGDPRRLLEERGLAGALLRSAVEDGPSDEVRGRSAAAFGLASGAIALTTARVAAASVRQAVAASGKAAAGTTGASAVSSAVGASAGASAGAGAGAGLGAVAGPAKGALLWSAGFAKWMVIGAATSALAGSVQSYVTRPAAPGVVAAATDAKVAGAPATGARAGKGAKVASPALAADVPPIPAADDEAEETVQPDTLGAQPATNLVPGSPRGATPKPIGIERAGAFAPAAAGDSVATRSRSLTEEIAALDEARHLAQTNAPSSALAALDRYDRTFPHGSLSPEATVLRVEILASSGDSARARSVGGAFLAATPDSPEARRVRALLATLPGATPSR